MAASRESQCNQLRPGLPGRGFPTPCFLLLRQTSRHFFHTLPSPSKAPRPILIFCWRPAHFLGFSRSKIAKTLPGRDATSVLCPFSFQPCVGAYVGRAHMYVHFGAIACMRSRSPVQPATFRSAGEGVPSYGFFLLRQTSRHFFHTLPSPSKAPTPILVFFRRSAHFLRFSRSKIAKTMPGRDAKSVLCPFSFRPCVGAY